MPEEFIPVAHISKVQLSAANGNGYHVEEYLFTNRRTFDRMTREQREMVRLNMAEQMTLF